MIKLTLREIVANWGRLVLTTLTIVLGVSFVSGSFILADSLRAVFSEISATAFAGVDAQVRAVPDELQNDQTIARFDGGILADINAVDEVRAAEAGLFTFETTYASDADGELVRPLGPPVFSASWAGPSPVSSFTLVEGAAPVGQQVAMDGPQIAAGGFNIGDMISISFPASEAEPELFELSGQIEFGEQEGGTGGAYFLLYDLPTLQRLVGAEGLVDSIVIAGENGVENQQLLEAVGTVLPEGIEVVAADVVIGEQNDQFGAFIDIFGNVLLGFAAVVLFVSIFIIYNTFAILVGQRTRLLGLLRSIGASRPQIVGMVMLESVIIGLLASLVGLLAGFPIAASLKWLFSLGGGEFPDGPLALQTRTVVAVFIVGLFVTVLSALIPAYKASKIAPLEAIRDAGARQRSLRFRVSFGLLVLIPGAMLLILGFFTNPESTTSTLSMIGFGAALTFIGVAMLSALFAGVATRALGRPIEATQGLVGRLARDNASRNPQRSAATASALMIGLALITGITVLVESIRQSFNDILDSAVAADVYVFEEAQNLPFSGNVPVLLAELPEVDEAAGFAQSKARIDAPNISGEIFDITGFDTATEDRIVDPNLLEGTLLAGSDGVLLSEDQAMEFGAGLGDTLTLEFPDGESEQLEVKGIFESTTFFGAITVDRQVVVDHETQNTVSFVGATYIDGVEVETATGAVEEFLSAYPQLTAQDNAELKKTQEGQLNAILYLMFGLLLLCFVVAFFGIVNTMALSVLERTREIGLLRAVGMTRGQLKRAIRWEAVIVSLFGAALGIVLGVVLGAAAVRAIPDDFVSKLGIPWTFVGIFLIGGALLGVLAALLPARRAAKMNVLDAIATE